MAQNGMRLRRRAASTYGGTGSGGLASTSAGVTAAGAAAAVAGAAVGCFDLGAGVSTTRRGIPATEAQSGPPVT